MEPIAHKFRSHREAREADRAYYRSLTPQARLELLLHLIARAQAHEPQQGLARIHRVAQLHRR